MQATVCPLCGVEQVLVGDCCSSCGQSFEGELPARSVAEVYAPPRAPLEGVHGADAAEQIRRQHLNHEASITSIGCLFYLGALALPTGVLTLIGGVFGGESFMIGLGVFYVLFGAIYFWVGRGLRRFDRRVRLPATLLFAIGLLGFPVGTLICGYALWLLHSAKGAMILSPEYVEIKRQTPHISYRTPIWMWAVLIAFLAAITVAVFSGLDG